MTVSAALKKPGHLDEDISPIWDELASQVRPAIGEAGLEALCLQVYRMRDAAQRISKDGLVVVDAKKNPIAHPAISIEKSAQTEVRAWLARFGSR